MIGGWGRWRKNTFEVEAMSEVSLESSDLADCLIGCGLWGQGYGRSREEKLRSREAGAEGPTGNDIILPADPAR